MSVKLCVYCGLEKEATEFSDEHIWPDALGGDFLDPAVWRTDDVCQRCNGLSGVFVDGAFIKNWFGTAERATGAREYLSLNAPGKGVLPLNYMGRLSGFQFQEGEIAEFWIGPCGEHIVHFRPDDSEQLWVSYAGGDPRRRSKKANAGRAYLSFTSTEEFWIVTTLAAFKNQFSGKRYVVNASLPKEWTAFESLDRSDPIQKSDLEVVEAIQKASQTQEHVGTQIVIPLDASSRFLSKLALALGYKVLGRDFLKTPYASTLRRGFREADPAKRQNIQVMGSGYLGAQRLGGAEAVMKWPGAWVLCVLITQDKLHLVVVTPAGKTMIVLVCDDPALIAALPQDVREGQVWLTIPALGEAVGPIPIPAFLAHQIGAAVNVELAALAAKRHDPNLLPPCR